MQAEVIHALGNPGGNGIDQGLQAAPIGALAYYSQLVHLKSLNGHYRCHVDITSGAQGPQAKRRIFQNDTDAKGIRSRNRQY